MIPRKDWHPTVTIERVMGLIADSRATLDDPGVCLHCGEDAFGVEPDAREYVCEGCGKPAVYGAEEILVMLVP